MKETGQFLEKLFGTLFPLYLAVWE